MNKSSCTEIFYIFLNKYMHMFAYIKYNFTFQLKQAVESNKIWLQLKWESSLGHYVNKKRLYTPKPIY